MLKKLFRKSLKREDQLRAAWIVSDILNHLAKPHITEPGKRLKDIDGLVGDMVKACGATSYNLKYKPDWATIPYPAVLCASVNEDVAHGIPGDYILKEGDLVTYDLGIRYKSACGDAAITVGVGNVSDRDVRLLRYSKNCLEVGIKAVKAGVQIREIGRQIENYAHKNGFEVVRVFSGHGIGVEMHEPPFIPHYEDLYSEEDLKVLQEGQVICLEPILTPGKGKVFIKEDGWTATTYDREKSAMFEEMILVTRDGSEVLTKLL